jgi:hypothetical protein
VNARDELRAHARKALYAAWTASADEIGSTAARTLDELGMLVPEGGAAELARLRERVAELEADAVRLQQVADREHKAFLDTHNALNLVVQDAQRLMAEKGVEALVAERDQMREQVAKEQRRVRLCRDKQKELRAQIAELKAGKVALAGGAMTQPEPAVDSNGDPLVDGAEYTDWHGDTWRAVFDATEFRLVAKASREPIHAVHARYEDATAVIRSSGPMVPVAEGGAR